MLSLTNPHYSLLFLTIPIIPYHTLVLITFREGLGRREEEDPIHFFNEIIVTGSTSVSGSLCPNQSVAAMEPHRDVHLRVTRLLATASTTALLAAEVTLRHHAGPPPGAVRNPEGSTERLPCRDCGGLPPQAGGQEPWPMRMGADSVILARARQCKPCRWATDHQRPREEWPHFGIRV